MRLRFGMCVFDSTRRELTRSGRRVSLTPKAFALLEGLISARPAPVARTALENLLWPDAIVESGNLHNLISEIRTAIGDDSHEVIRTVHRFGYAFDASGVVEEEARFAVILGPDEILLRSGENTVGRDPSDAIVITAPEVSRHHARFTVDGDVVTVEDLGSKNGTFVGARPVSGRIELRAGDEIFIGTVRLRLCAASGLPSTRTAARTVES